jgi:hypothetical protein
MIQIREVVVSIREFAGRSTCDVMEYVVDVNGQLLLGVETDPNVTELFPEGEAVTLRFAEGCIQVLPANKNSR